MFCQKCGKKLPEGSVACNYCGTGVVIAQANAAPKNNKVIEARIATKKAQIKSIGFLGPVLAITVGVVACVFLFYNLFIVLIGLIIIGFGAWWTSSRSNEQRKLQNEIRELEVEMEAE